MAADVALEELDRSGASEFDEFLGRSLTLFPRKRNSRLCQFAVAVVVIGCDGFFHPVGAAGVGEFDVYRTSPSP